MQKSFNNRVIQKIESDLGELILTKLNDPNITDINVNPDGNVWIKNNFSQVPSCITRIDKNKIESIIRAVSSSLGKNVGSSSAIVGGEFPILNARFEGVLSPVAYPGPGFSIRKRAHKVFSLKSYHETGIINENQFHLIKGFIQERKNILVAGGTYSGKTTFLNALIGEINNSCPEDRLVICEDTPEIQSSSLNTFKLISNDNNPLSQCIKTSLRLSPDRIIIGEIRDAYQAKEALQAWNTGHQGGVCSIHANTALDSLHRLEDFCITAFNYKSERLISRSVDVIIYIKIIDGKRKVTEMLAIKGFNKDYVLESYENMAF